MHVLCAADSFSLLNEKSVGFRKDTWNSTILSLPLLIMGLSKLVFSPVRWGIVMSLLLVSQTCFHYEIS